MIELICRELNNYFEPNHGSERRRGHFSIANGSIAPIDFLKNGQYFRIIGSTLNDGVYLYPTTELFDEDFVGVVCPMEVPKAVQKLAVKISEFEAENKKTAFVSESFGGYSYTKAQGKQGALNWKEAFADDLKRWRKIC